MNKQQYIQLLKLRGITDLEGIPDLRGMTLAEAIKKSGGSPTLDEMFKVNEDVMHHYLTEYLAVKELNKVLEEKLKKLENRDNWLTCLEHAGVDNWDGHDVATDLMEEYGYNN